MNFSCYGNAEPHLHWHIVPRCADDPHPRRDPWENIARFDEEITDPDQARDIAAQVLSNFA
jgi:diadenosine tetraphosphate (Ap4A) HIT family hydrolase